MAVVNITYVPDSLTASFTHDWKDTISESYLVEYDSIPTNIYQALLSGQTYSGTPKLPSRHAPFLGSPGIFVRSIAPAFMSENRKVIKWTYNYGPLSPGEQPEQQVDNPLNRPPIYNIERFDSEYVIDSARNVESLKHGDGKGGMRPPLTDGPIVNAAGKRPDEPLVDTQSNAVLVITKNYSSLVWIENINLQYQRTTNSDTVGSYSPRRLKFLSCESNGQQTEGPYTYYPGTTRIEVKATTDIVIDNVGYEYWHEGGDGGQVDDCNGENKKPGWRKARDVDCEPMLEPINLNLDGGKAKDSGGATRIMYRYLKETSYAPLVS